MQAVDERRDGDAAAAGPRPPMRLPLTHMSLQASGVERHNVAGDAERRDVSGRGGRDDSGRGGRGGNGYGGRGGYGYGGRDWSGWPAATGAVHGDRDGAGDRDGDRRYGGGDGGGYGEASEGEDESAAKPNEDEGDRRGAGDQLAELQVDELKLLVQEMMRRVAAQSQVDELKAAILIILTELRDIKAFLSDTATIDDTVLAAVVHGQGTVLAAVDELRAEVRTGAGGAAASRAEEKDGAGGRGDQLAELQVIKDELGELKDMMRILAAGQRLSLTALGGGADSSAEELKTELRCVAESVRELREQVATSLAPVPQALQRDSTP